MREREEEEEKGGRGRQHKGSDENMSERSREMIERHTLHHRTSYLCELSILPTLEKKTQGVSKA